MKERGIKIGVLTGVFMIAIVLFAYLTNRGNTDMTADMGEATLPSVSFGVEGYTINTLAGYTNKMNIAAMRDTITPIATTGEVELNIDPNENKITLVEYELLSLDGEKSIFTGKVKDVGKSNTFQLGEALQVEVESVLKITLHINDEEVYYYTRIIKSDRLYAKESMDFTKDFHTKTFDRTQMGSLSNNLEYNAEEDNVSFQHVTIHSDLDHITWGDLKPTIVGDVTWSVKESNISYTSIQVEYQVSCVDAAEIVELYNIKEFFRVRYQEGTMYLLDYDRTMNQVFDGKANALDEKGIKLGIAPLDLQYMTNKDGTIVSFVQEREVWNYDQENDALSLVFSFASSESKELRHLYREHKVKLITMEESGNTTFVVYGYMNRGEHEGEVGAAVYYYDIGKNAVEEKVFIPSNKSFAITEEELGRLVYYNHGQELLYIMTDGTLYKVQLLEDKQDVIIENLQVGQYMASEDGHLLAYQTNGEVETATQVKVLNLANGKEIAIDAPKGENIKPLGFVQDDFVYGVSRGTDAGNTIAGQHVQPMYKLEICDNKGAIVKNYALDQIYIVDVFIEGNMITMNRATKSDMVYTNIGKDYITNNEEKVESNIMLESLQTDIKELEMKLIFSEGIRDKEAKILKPKQVLFENPTTVSFDTGNTEDKYYVYGKGAMLGIYDKAGYAVQKADEYSGVVVTGKQAYVWERGNRELTYELGLIAPFSIMEGESTLAACISQMLILEEKTADVMAELASGKSPIEIVDEYSGGVSLDLTGCTTEQILYIIGKGTPVIAMIDSNNAILLTGYGKVNIQYMNPSTGTVELQAIENLNQMVTGSGNTFIGYIK